MDDRELFGRRIRAIREAANLSRETAAEKARITANYLGEIERGEKWPAFDMLGQLASALNVAPASFFQFQDEEVDPAILLAKINQLLEARDVKQLQQALRLLKALFVA
jgi:transcriptional regulator with XRE-family HTH domain